ncbi:MAG TPA: glycosyltransferase family 2 protein [Chthonomonadaceae bacterium]|nr:glycosyltransferase family 2 protein [Chthonomonadaceae bacterium]
MTSALIPAYNEAERIAATIAALRSIASQIGLEEIVVVDDGSQDDTAARAEAAGADVVFRQANRGKGAALQAAFDLSRGQIVLLLDADLGESAAEAVKLVEPVRSGAADMTIATFPVIPGKGGGFGLVVKLARWGIRRLTGQQMQAPLSGQRAARRKVIEAAGGFAAGWGVEIGLTVAALRSGYRVVEVPTTMTHRVTGRAPADILHRAAQLYGAARILFRLWLFPDRPHIPRAALPPRGTE